jgi:acyl carrier protein
VTQAEVIQTIQPLFRDVLDQPDLLLTPASNASNVDDWDSLAHINIVMAIERHYKVKFALGELQGLKNVGEMAELIIRKTAKS